MNAHLISTALLAIGLENRQAASLCLLVLTIRLLSNGRKEEKRERKFHDCVVMSVAFLGPSYENCELELSIWIQPH